MPRILAFDWEADYLAGVEADVSGRSVHVRRCFRYDWPQQGDAPLDAAALGRWLQDVLKRDGIAGTDAHVVLPREAVVVRKLELPNVPENELPDLVRFQAATKSSTPLDKLSLDFLPLPPQAGSTLRPVLMVTAELERVGRIKTALAAAGIELKSIGISAVTVAELVMRPGTQSTADANQAILVIFQDSHRVEITSLIHQQVIFSHHSRLAGTGDAAGIRASVAEVNRTVIALNQSQSGLEISEVFLIHAGDADPAFESALTERFGGRLHVVDVLQVPGISIGQPADSAGLASHAPALGALLAAGDARVPAIDFLAPRRPSVAPDRTKLRIGLGAAAAALVGGLGYWMISSQLAELVAETTVMESRAVEMENEVKQGALDLEAAQVIGNWVAAGRDPLAVMDRLNQLSPGSDKLYLQQVDMNVGSRDGTYHVEALGAAIAQSDVERFQEDLAANEMQVIPTRSAASKDPDYPRGVVLKVELPLPAAGP